MSQNRRQFLTETSQLAAGSILGMAALDELTSQAALLNRVSENEKINVALIGTGGRGNYLLNLITQHNDVVVTTLCDVNQQNLGRTAEKVNKHRNKKVKQVHDFRRVLDDDSIDAVVVATQHHWHTPIAVRALDAKKHVYVEKPASHVLREGQLLVDAAKRNKRVVQHGTQMRSSEVTEAAGKVLASGVLGEIKQSKAWGVEPRRHHPQPVADQAPPEYLDYNMWLGPAPKRPFNPNRFRRWNSFRDTGNGEIGGDGIHDIDMARWGLGVTTQPTQITAQGSRAHLTGESDFPDNMLVTWQYADGKVLIYENRNFAPYNMHGWDNGNVFYGTEGYMIFSRRGYFQTYLGAKEEKGPGLKGSAGVEQHVRNFFDSVKGERDCIADAEIAHLSCSLVHLGEIAYRIGRVLHFDPKTESFPHDKQANALLTKPHRKPWGFAADT